MLIQIKAGTTSKILQFPIFDSSSTTGGMLTGLVYNTSNLKAYYNREGAAGASTSISLATATKGTWSTGGFIAVDGTNMTGWYELHIPDAAIAAGAKSVGVKVFGATNMVPVNFLIELTAVDNQDTVRYGLTALPNVASGSAGAVITSGTGTAQLSVSSGAVTVGTNNDKTDYSLTVSPPTASEIVLEIDSSSTQLAAILEDTGTTLQNAIEALNDVDATTVAESVWLHESRTLTSAGAGGATAQEVWEYSTRVLTASTNIDFPTAEEIRIEMDSSSTQLTAIVEDTSTTLPNQISALNDIDATSVAEFVWQHESRTLTSAGSGGATAQEVWEYSTRTLTADTNIDIPTAAEIRQEIDSSSTMLDSISSAISSLDLVVDGIAEDTSTDIPNQIDALNDLDATSVWDYASRTITGTVTVATNNDKTGYTVSTVSDKTGYSLVVTPPTAAEIRAEIDSSSTQLTAILEDTGTTIPNQISALNDIDATSVATSVWEHESRTLTSAGASGATAQEVWEYSTRVLTADTNINYPTASEIVAEIDASSTQLATILEDTETTLPGLISSLNDVDASAIWNYVDRTLTSAGASGATAQEVWEYGSRSLTDKSGFSLSVTPPTAGTIADAVWNEARSGHTSSGTFGQGIASVQGNVTGSVATVSNPVTITQTVAANVIQIQNTDLTGDDSQIPDGFSYFFNVLAPSLTINDIRDFSDTEIQQIRYRLGLDGATNTPSVDPTLSVSIVDGSITSATFDNSTAFPLTEDSSLANIADAVLDEVVETGWTLRELVRILAAYAAGRTSGSGTTSVAIRDILNTKNRITASLDEDGNRVGVTLVGD